jgi:hypothetical protein
MLGISKQSVVIVDMDQRCVLFSIGANAIIGWTPNDLDFSLMLYFDVGECVHLRLKTHGDLVSVVKRLEFFTKGCRVFIIIIILFFLRCNFKTFTQF